MSQPLIGTSGEIYTNEWGGRRRVLDHSDAQAMFAVVSDHLRKYPRDASLFAIDYRQALADLGFHISPPIRSHLAAQFSAPGKRSSALYKRIRGGTKPQVDFLISFDTSTDNIQGSAASPGGGASEASPTSVVETNAVSATNNAGFGVVVQLTDHIINRIFTIAYKEDLIKKKWEGSLLSEWTEYGVEVESRYEFNLAQPTISFDTSFEEGVAAHIGLSGFVEVEFGIFPLLSPTHREFQQTMRIDIAVELTAIGTAVISPTTDQRHAVFLDLRDLRDLEIAINNQDLSENILSFLRALLLRLARTHLAEQPPIPLSFDVETVQRAGVPIIAVWSRILSGHGSRPGTLSICLDTTGQGDPKAIEHIVPPGSGFALLATRNFLLNQVWPLRRNSMFPHRDGRVTIHNPQLDLKQGHIWSRVEAVYKVNCLPDIDARATARMNFVAFRHDDVWLSRINPVGDPDIELDPGDRIFYTVIAGFLLSLFGIGSVVSNALILNIIIEALLGRVEQQAGEALKGFNIGFRDRIPDTNIVVAASTPIVPAVTPEGITAHGDVVLSVE